MARHRAAGGRVKSRGQRKGPTTGKRGRKRRERREASGGSGSHPHAKSTFRQSRSHGRRAAAHRSARNQPMVGWLRRHGKAIWVEPDPWGKPVFIRRRTADEVAAAKKGDGEDLRDPQKDGDRVQNDTWLVMIGLCTHLGCIPLGQKGTDPKGEFGGWFCPCHGSHYDTSGRIRKGPAPTNLPVPPYKFVDDKTILIG